MPTAPKTHRTSHATDRAPADKRYNEQRPERDSFYGSARWKRFRAWFLSRHPLCIDCEAIGRSVAAFMVDHVIPRDERPELELDEDNCQGLCMGCHNRKTARDRSKGKE